jgi:flagellar basal body-associated protein FliL
MNTVARGEKKEAIRSRTEQLSRQPRAHVTLDGPTFAVQMTADTFRTVTVRTIVVELNADLDETSLKNLEENLRDLNYEIKDALQNIIISEGYQSILLPKDRQRLQNKLKQEIIRLLGANVGEKEIKAVLFDSFQIGD